MPLDLLQLAPLRDCAAPAASVEALAEGCAARVVETHPAEALRCAPPLWSDHAEAERRFFFGGHAEADFNPLYRFPAATLAALPGARVAGEGVVVLTGDRRVVAESFTGDHVLQRDGRFLRRSLTVQLDGAPEAVPFVLHRPRGPVRRVGGPAVLAANYWQFNYHHWLIEVLPRLRPALEAAALAGAPVLVPADGPAFQRESLDLFGLAPERRLGFDGGEWEVERLYVPSVGVFAPHELRWVRERAVAGLDAPADGDGLLYVTRADAASRRVANEDEVAALLRGRGFEVVSLSGMPFREQVRRFAGARVVVGPHGAGLTNVLFAPPGAALVELMPADTVNHCFWLMANALGLRYTFVSGPTRAPERDLRVPLDRLARAVDVVLGEG